MPRYIDAEALETALLAEKNFDRSNAYGAYECDLIAHVYESARQLCERIPTADVEPVRHGRWIDTEGMWECTECGYRTYHEFALINEIQECGSMIYCERCGAKMDGESEVEDDG